MKVIHFTQDDLLPTTFGELMVEHNNVEWDMCNKRRKDYNYMEKKLNR